MLRVEGDQSSTPFTSN